MSHGLDRTLAAIQGGIENGLHIGAQLSVSVDGKPVGEIIAGDAAPGVAMTADSMLPWFSMTKAVTAAAVMQQWERGALALDDPVALHVPEFAENGKAAVTVRHLLLHTGGFRQADGQPPAGAFSRDLADNVAMICAAPLEDGWVPGRKAGYHPTSGMAMLGEIVQRLSGRSFEAYVREEIFAPLGMDSCFVGIPIGVQASLGDRIGIMHNTAGEQPLPLLGLNDPTVLARVLPGAGGRGPMRELVRLYECLDSGGTRDGVRLLSPQTVEAMTARHRVGMFDETFRTHVDWGLGLHVDMILMGRHCSPRAAGHGGAQSSVAFCDPEHGLAVACVFNGMAGVAHYGRFESVMSALYVDLGLAGEDDPGRDHNVPRVAT